MDQSTDQIKTVVAFKSSVFDSSADAPDLHLPLGRDLATYLISKLSSQECDVLSLEPIEADEGWYLELVIEGTRFGVFVQWAPIGNPPADYWLVQPVLKKGVWRTFFGRAIVESRG